MAALTMQTVTFAAQSAVVPDDKNIPALAADEVREFCSRGFARA